MKKKFKFTWIEKSYMESTVYAESKERAWEMFETTEEFDDNTTCNSTETICGSGNLEEIKAVFPYQDKHVKKKKPVVIKKPVVRKKPKYTNFWNVKKGY